MDCREAERFIDLAIDGEIEHSEESLFDGHLRACSTCRGRFQRQERCASALRVRLNEATRATTAPLGLKTRIRARVEDCERTQRLTWGRAISVTLGVSMIAVLSWSGASKPPLVSEETVARHSVNLPPEVRAGQDANRIQRFLSSNLRYPVAVPRFERRPGVRLVGARLSSVDERDAAYMMYDRHGAKLSLFAYPKPSRFSRPTDFEEVYVGSRVVLVGKRRGYNVVAWEEGDVVYSLVSDIDPQEMVDLVSSLL